ncbi:MAG: class I SAM-dependent DNA methyltransferase [Candidatus Hydrogenedentota bacterium]
MNHSEIVSFLWNIADLIRDSFKRGKYQDVILPLTVLRRLDQVLAPTREKVRERQATLKAQGIKELDAQLRRASGYAFYNTSKFDFERLLADSPNVAANLRKYIAGFSENMREVIEKFDFDNTITKLDQAGLLFQVLERFKNVDLHPDRVDNATMGSIFEELIRKFNEALDENPGEHFTPRDVVRLMADLLMAGDEARLRKKDMVFTVYDPCCGTGGMLTIARDRIRSISPDAEIHLFGQEVNPETYAVAKSDLYIKDPSGRDADRILFGSTLSNDRHPRTKFDYLIANPPYGKDWARDEEAVTAEHEKGEGGRFVPGLPRKSDGQLLFLLHMIAHMQKAADGGTRLAIIMNGSPLFTGDAGGGESEIRRWILENDWLEALIALPEQLFYNTGIATYIWILSNRKEKHRRGKVKLINATEKWVAMRKSLGNKRREISEEQLRRIVDLYLAIEAGESVRIFDSTDFGYRKITVERPLKLNFQVSVERIERLKTESGFENLAKSKKKEAKVKAAEEAEGRKEQAAVLSMLAKIPTTLFKNRPAFEKALEKAAQTAGMKIAGAVRKAIISALSERDETAEICRDKEGKPEPDSDLRDTENVPLKESIETYFEREVKPHVPDAWINTETCDERDGKIGKVGYEINFNRYFYKYTPPRPLEEIEAEIKALETEIVAGMKGITG